MKPGLTLEVPPGISVAVMCETAQEIADKVGRGVGFQFNSVRCVAMPGGSAERLAEAQQEAQRTQLVVHSDTINIETEVEDAR